MFNWFKKKPSDTREPFKAFEPYEPTEPCEEIFEAGKDCISVEYKFKDDTHIHAVLIDFLDRRICVKKMQSGFSVSFFVDKDCSSESFGWMTSKDCEWLYDAAWSTHLVARHEAAEKERLKLIEDLSKSANLNRRTK